MDLSWLLASVDFIAVHKEAIISVLGAFGLATIIPFLSPRTLTFKYGLWIGKFGGRVLRQRFGESGSRLAKWLGNTLDDFAEGIKTGLYFREPKRR